MFKPVCARIQVECTTHTILRIIDFPVAHSRTQQRMFFKKLKSILPQEPTCIHTVPVYRICIVDFFFYIFTERRGYAGNFLNGSFVKIRTKEKNPSNQDNQYGDYPVLYRR